MATYRYRWTIQIEWPDGETINKSGDNTTNQPYPQNDFSGAIFAALTRGRPRGARITSFDVVAV